jgi:hypothetical protein
MTMVFERWSWASISGQVESGRSMAGHIGRWAAVVLRQAEDDG